MIDNKKKIKENSINKINNFHYINDSNNKFIDNEKEIIYKFDNYHKIVLKKISIPNYIDNYKKKDIYFQNKIDDNQNDQIIIIRNSNNNFSNMRNNELMIFIQI